MSSLVWHKNELPHSRSRCCIPFVYHLGPAAASCLLPDLATTAAVS